MTQTISLPAFCAVCAGAAGRVRAALKVLALVGVAACGADGDPSGTVSNGSIRGTVVDNTGAMVAGAVVELSGNAQPARSSSTDVNGIYTFADVPAGTYTLTVTPPAGFVIGAAGTVSVAVSGDAQADASALVLDRVIVTGSIRGTVTDNLGATVGFATVVLSGNAQASRATHTGASGTYIFTGVQPGSYTLTVVPPSGYSLGPAGTASVAVTSGAEAAGATFVLNRATPEGRDSAFVAALRTRLDVSTAADQFSGTVLVLRDGRTLFEGAWGLADRERAIPNTLLTQFRVGSMNKMLTAVATLQLVQAGKLRLDATLGTYLPDYPNTELASRVTLHHLLTHTGGTGDIFGPEFMANRSELRDPSDYIRLYGTRGLLFAPGSQWQYSNYGFVLLGAIIERVTGMSYDDYVAAHVLAPAAMTATDAAPEDMAVSMRSVGYTRQLVPDTLVSNAPLLPYRGTPAGGGYSTVGDFARFAAAIQEGRLLDPAHTALLLDGKVQINPSERYAYGFVDRVLVGKRFVGHNGGNAGMNGELVFEPNGGYVIVVLANLDPPAAGQIAGFILGQLLAPTPP